MRKGLGYILEMNSERSVFKLRKKINIRVKNRLCKRKVIIEGGKKD